MKNIKRNSSSKISLNGITTQDSSRQKVRSSYLSPKFPLKKGVILGLVDLRFRRESGVVMQTLRTGLSPWSPESILPFTLLGSCHPP